MRIQACRDHLPLSATGHAAQAPAPQAGASALPDSVALAGSVLSFCGLAPLPLKSLAYQPEPLSWKPAAVSIFWNDALPHSGQEDSNGSLTFRRYSFWNPQDEQRYS